MQINHLPEAIECYKVFKGKAYFYSGGRSNWYEFVSLKQAEEWRNKRSLQNRKSKTFEMFMCTNENGEVDYIKYYKLHESIGILPEDPYCLAMVHALEEIYGSQEISVDDILNNQKKRKEKVRETLVKKTTTQRKDKLKQLTDSCNLPEYMGELLLSEILLDNMDANKHLRNRAALLGLTS
jgi:hypothetical protein